MSGDHIPVAVPAFSGFKILTPFSDEELSMIGMTRTEAEEAESEAHADKFYSFQVIFGLHDLENPKGAKIATLTQNYVTLHPQFHKPSPYNNDIALIRLKGKSKNNDIRDSGNKV